jgi:hypothetical protein
VSVLGQFGDKLALSFDMADSFENVPLGFV